jgi:hypothetical protein
MKKLMCLLPLIIASASNAAVVDSFKCEGKLEDLLTGEKTTSSASFDILRRPDLIAPTPSDTYTYGAANLNLSINTKDHRLSANLQITYEHAVRAINGATDARQDDCTIVSASFCDLSDGLCADGTATCASVQNPFDPIYGWAKVPFIDGAPVFDGRLMRPLKGIITNDNGVTVGRYTSTCTHTGTSVQ